MKYKTFTVRIDPDLLDQLHVVAEYEGRSANKQIVALIHRCVEQYEHTHGKIILPSKTKE